jgi:hypothetical protein
VVVVVCAAAASLPALAQVVSVTHPANLTSMDIADEVLLQDAQGNYFVTPSGRFKLYTGPNSPAGRGGNPTIVGDENLLIASKSGGLYNGFTSGFLVAVDPDDTQNAQFIDPFAMAVAQAPNADLTRISRFWTQAFSPGSRDVIGAARIPIELDNNNNVIGWVLIRTEYTLLGDALQVSIIISNEGTQPHNFGLRVVVDGGFGQPGVNRDGQPFFFPDGSVLVNEATIKGPFNANNYTFATYDPQNPTVACRGTVGKSDTTELFNPGIANFSGGMPDELQIGQLRNAGIAVWNFIANPTAPLLHEDWCYAVRWTSKRLAPGESRRHVTWYGVGSSTPNYNPPFAIMAYAPVTLKAVQDPITGEFSVVDSMGRSPFPLAVFIDNFGPSPILNAAARVRLPSGFALSSGTPTLNMGIIPHDALVSATWNCVATATRPGRADFKFTGPSGRVLDAIVNIPTIPILNPLPASQPAYEMVSFPYLFGNNAAPHVLTSLGSLTPGGPATIVRYDPTEANPTLRYKFYPDPFAATIDPGNAYWLLNLNRLAAVLPSDRGDVPTNVAFNLIVSAGWNQIGNPFQVTEDLMHLGVVDMAGRRWTMQQAIDRGLLVPTLFSWDPLNRKYVWAVDPSDVTLDPYMGYWFFANVDLVLLAPPPTYQWTMSTRPSAAPVLPPLADSWRLSLVATTANAGSERVTMGASADARDGWDARDVPAPPEPAGLREARVKALVAGPSGVPCLTDILSKTHNRYEWSFEISTNQVNAPVTLNWPDLSTLPADLVPTLVDLESGARVYLRTSPGYVFTSSPVGQTHRFQLVVAERSSVGAMITSAQVVGGGRGATVAYTLAAPAQVNVTVRNIAGLTVRELVAGRQDAAGLNQVAWNGANDRGTPVPAGRYIVQITARSPETGQSYQVVRTLQLGR